MFARLAKVLVPLGLLGVCIAGAVVLFATRPSVDARPPDRPAPLVRVLEVSPQSLRLRVRTQGTVAPRTQSDLIPEVSGPVVWVSESFVSGGFFEAGEALLRIDSRDYAVALERARAGVERTRSEHERARKELERVARLAERGAASQAQLDDALNAERVRGAALREARATLEQAQRDRERTEIRAPFAGRVRSEQVDVGQFVNRGTPIARVYAIDYAEVRLPVADDELAFLELPLWYRGENEDHEGPEVYLTADFAGAQHSWPARVVRTEGEIDPRTRMVHVVARIDDPYGRQAVAHNGSDSGAARPPLAVGVFVAAEILGREVDGVMVVPRAAMRGADRVLVVDVEDRLRFRSAEIIRSLREGAVIRTQLEPGDRISVSTINAAIEGMTVRPVVERGGKS